MLRILIVDDDAELVASVVKYFERSGWEAKSARHGKEALETLNASYDAVILDLQMPVMDGEQALAEIRKRFELDGVCVVLLTAFGNVGSAVRSMRLGAHQYLMKPVDLQLLKRILTAGIARQKITALQSQLLASPGVDAILRTIGSILSETVPAGTPHLVLLDDKGSIKSVQQGTKHFEEPQVGMLRAAGDRRFVKAILRDRHPIFVDDSVDMSNWGPILPNAKAMLAAPIPAAGGKVAGIIDLESVEVGALDASWEDVVVYLAHLAGISMEIAGKAKAEAAQAEAEANLRSERHTRENMVLLARELGHRLLTPVQTITFEADTMIAKDLVSPGIDGLPARVGASLRRRVKAIRESASDVAGVCQYLRDVSREIPVRPQELILLKLIRACLDVHESELESKQISLAAPDDRWRSLTAQGDPALLRYSLECLVRNAIEAIEEARKKRPAMASKRLRKSAIDRLTVALGVDEGRNCATISVSDTGDGVKDEYRQRLFTALFTSKERPFPAGTGLFSVNRYMLLQRGFVELAPNMSQGATFVLGIPLADQQRA